STYPNSRSPCCKAASKLLVTSAEADARKPRRGIGGACCASAVRGVPRMLKMRVTMPPTLDHHMIISSHQSSACRTPPEHTGDRKMSTSGSRTLRLRRGRQRERGTSGRCLPSLAAGCSARPSRHERLPLVYPARLLDHLRRLEQDRWRNGEPKGLGGLEIDDQLEPHELRDRELSWMR